MISETFYLNNEKNNNIIMININNSIYILKISITIEYKWNYKFFLFKVIKYC